MSGEEVKAHLLTNDVLNGDSGIDAKGVSKFPGTRYEFKQNTYLYANSGGYKDAGKWRIEAEKLCTQLENWQKSEICSQVSKGPGGKIAIGSWYKEK